MQPGQVVALRGGERRVRAGHRTDPLHLALRERLRIIRVSSIDA
jgi:hypothetical protein